jgi:hypothetical protein
MVAINSARVATTLTESQISRMGIGGWNWSDMVRRIGGSKFHGRAMSERPTDTLADRGIDNRA